MPPFSFVYHDFRMVTVAQGGFEFVRLAERWQACLPNAEIRGRPLRIDGYIARHFLRAAISQHNIKPPGIQVSIRYRNKNRVSLRLNHYEFGRVLSQCCRIDNAGLTISLRGCATERCLRHLRDPIVRFVAGKNG